MRERVAQPDRRRGRRACGSAPSTRSARACCAAMPSWSGCKPQLHHPRHRRPDAADQAADAGRGHRRQALAGRACCSASSSAGRIAALTPDKVAERRGRRVRQRPARSRSTRQYQERLPTLNAVDFGDLLLHCVTLFAAASRRAGRSTSAASATSWSTSTRTPTSRSICGCGCWRRARRTSAASATTTSRSTAGAAPRSATSCASRRISPAPRSSGWSATTARRRTSSPPPRGLIAHNEGRLGKTLWTEVDGGRAASRCAACGTARRRRASIGEEIEALQRDRHALGADRRSWCAPASRPASSRSASSRWACPIA